MNGSPGSLNKEEKKRLEKQESKKAAGAKNRASGGQTDVANANLLAMMRQFLYSQKNESNAPGYGSAGRLNEQSAVCYRHEWI